MLNIKTYNEWDDNSVLNDITSLCLSHSKTFLPLKKIENLPSLETIDLSHMHSTALFHIGERIKNLRLLSQLDISNTIDHIFPSMLSIGKFPVSLTYLNMSHINFENFGMGKLMQNLKNLHTLNISNTGIRCIPLCPPSLRVLDISSNNMVYAFLLLDTEEEIKPIMNLQTLIIYGNENIEFNKHIPLHILQF